LNFSRGIRTVGYLSNLLQNKPSYCYGGSFCFVHYHKNRVPWPAEAGHKGTMVEEDSDGKGSFGNRMILWFPRWLSRSLLRSAP